MAGNYYPGNFYSSMPILNVPKTPTFRCQVEELLYINWNITLDDKGCIVKVGDRLRGAEGTNIVEVYFISLDKEKWTKEISPKTKSIHSKPINEQAKKYFPFLKDYKRICLVNPVCRRGNLWFITFEKA